MNKLIEEQIKDLLHQVIIHTPIKIEETTDNEYNRGYIDYQDWVVDTVKEIEPKLIKLYYESLTKFIDSALEIHEHNMKVGEDYQYAYGDMIDFLSKTKKELYKETHYIPPRKH
jgi:hypothetical protein